MTPRQVATAVFKLTQPIHWELYGDAVGSPRLVIDGVPGWVEIQASRLGRIKLGHLFPTVHVCHRDGGTYRVYNPWSWPVDLLYLHMERRRERERTFRRLLSVGLRSRRPPRNLEDDER